VMLSSKLATRVAGLPCGRISKWLVLVAWLAIVVLAVPLASKLSRVVEENSTAELPRGAESTQVAELADRFPGGNVSTGIVVYVRQGGVTAADRAKVEDDRRAFAPLAAQEIPPAEASADGAAMLLAVPLNDDDTLTDDAARVRAVASNNLPAGLNAELTGPAGNELDASEAFEGIDAKVLLITAAVVALLLLCIYRSPVLWLLPLLTVWVALQIGNAVTYLLAEHAGMLVASGTASIMTVLVIGVGTDYALLLLARYREELRRQPDRHVAMAVALRRAGPAIAASSATVSLGLLCLLTADMGFNYALGPDGAIGVLCGLVAMTTLLPAILVILGRWVFWPFVPHHGTEEPAHRSLWGRIGRRVAKRPRIVWLSTALVLGVVSLGALGLQTGLDNEHRIRTTPGSVAGQRLLAAHYPAGESRPVQVVADAPAAAAVTASLRDVRGVAQVRPAESSTDGAQVKVPAVLTDPTGSTGAAATVDRVRDAVHAVAGANALVGGGSASTVDQDRAQAHDRRVVIPLVLVVVFTVLILLLRGLVAPLLLIATVVLSFFSALGASWLLFSHLFDFPALDVQVPLMGFLFLVALGVDYNIFLVARIREETIQYGHQAGVLRGLAVTGGVISSAGLVLAATFGALAVLPLVFLVEIGILVALGVLLDTFLVRSVLVPALALDVGPAFWWPAFRPRAPEPDDAIKLRNTATHGPGSGGLGVPSLVDGPAHHDSLTGLIEDPDDRQHQQEQ
jgi:RND superfamily putative drug exporter